MLVHKVRKGDVIALAYVRSVTHAFGSGRGSERTTCYTLARVNGANAMGEATSLVRAGGSVLQLRRKDYALRDVQVIRGENHDKAKRLFAALRWDSDEFTCLESFKQHIRGA